MYIYVYHVFRYIYIYIIYHVFTYVLEIPHDIPIAPINWRSAEWEKKDKRRGDLASWLQSLGEGRGNEITHGIT